MRVQRRTEPSIVAHRVLVEARLASLLERAKSPATLDDVKLMIFHESDDRFTAYVARMTSLFENAQSTVDIDMALPLIQDAWNYFPHRALAGRCPAEIILPLISW